MVIDWFWAGAQDVSRSVDVADVLRRAGGSHALRSLSASSFERALIELGLKKRQAERWARASQRVTRGVALTLDDDGYPERLRGLPRSPPVLCCEGDLRALREPAVAVVGTRRCTPYGRAVARHLGGALAAAGVSVVSGLARGIDAAAHGAALQVGRTIAVVAHGLDHTAPASNRRLRRDLLASGGLVVSTLPDDTEPRPFLFPLRNEWIAGLSDVVVVVEAPLRSGALYTSQAGVELGRDVYAVPGPLGAEASRGCLELIEQGAGIICDVERFVADVSGQSAARHEAWKKQLFAGASLNDVAKSAGWSCSELLARIAELELSGEIVRMPGHRYAPGVRVP